MADLTGYIGPDVTTGTYAYSTGGPLSFLEADVNTSVTTMRDNLVLSGWTNPTLMDGDQDGTLAAGSLVALSFPFHVSGSDHSGVPDVFGGAFAGTFDSMVFQFYDPFALPPDPDPTGSFVDGFEVIGVPLSISAIGTLSTFLGAASAHTRWEFDFVSGDGVEAILAITAHHTGPDANVDGVSPTGFWAPSGLYLGGAGPLGGGWNLYSAPAPNTTDQMKLTIREGDFGGAYPAFDFEMPAGSGNSVTFQLSHVNYNFGINGYQIAFRGVDGEDAHDTGGSNVLAAALNVPDEMGPVTLGIASVTNPSGSAPVLIETSDPHGLAMQDRVKISGSVGATQINGAWWVAKVVTDKQFYISADPLVFIFGDGNAYTSGGQVFKPPSGTNANISAIRNDVADPVLFETATVHGFVPGDIVEVSTVGGIPLLDDFWSVAEVPTPQTFEIATQDTGLLIGDGTTYTPNSATLTKGLFQAMVATSDLTTTLYGRATVACQGVFGSFSGEGTPQRTLATYGVAIHPIYNGFGSDGVTTASKPVVAAPYVALRIATGHETRIAGTLWNSYVKLQQHPYQTMETFNDVSYIAWVPHDIALGLLNATLFFRATND